MDEIDALGQSRGGESEASARRVVTTLLVELTNLRKLPAEAQVVLVALTNLPDSLDAALLRRFDAVLHAPLPGPSDRAAIVRAQLAGVEHQLDERAFACVAAMTEGWSGSDLEVRAPPARRAATPRRRAPAARRARRPCSGMRPCSRCASGWARPRSPCAP